MLQLPPDSQAATASQSCADETGGGAAVAGLLSAGRDVAGDGALGAGAGGAVDAGAGGSLDGAGDGTTGAGAVCRLTSAVRAASSCACIVAWRDSSSAACRPAAAPPRSPGG